MLTPGQVEQQINRLITYTVEAGLCNEQFFAFQRSIAGHCTEITFLGAEHVSTALKDRNYGDIYRHLLETKAFNIKMIDGALIQMMYAFCAGGVERHRLSFFPSPDLEEFQTNPDIYLRDEVYADIVGRKVVSFPIRFDYNSGDSTHQVVQHPKSHLTLGDYEHCRIPVTAPMTPRQFLDFILRNFYETGEKQYADSIPTLGGSFPESIVPDERAVVHVTIPQV